jgi:hypothetical protein
MLKISGDKKIDLSVGDNQIDLSGKIVMKSVVSSSSLCRFRIVVIKDSGFSSGSILDRMENAKYLRRTRRVECGNPPQRLPKT